MRIYFSKSVASFFNEDLHGSRLLQVQDPAWQRPTNAEGEPDFAATLPLITQINPGCKIPADAVEITADLYTALQNGQSAGKRIVADASGKPVLADPEPIAFAALKAQELANFRADRGKMLDCLSGLAGRFARAGDAASALACDALSKGLLDLPAFPTVAAAQDLPALKAAMKARYNTLLAAVPAPVMAAYKGVLA